MVPYAEAAPLAAKLVKNGTQKTYNADLPAFLKAWHQAAWDGADAQLDPVMGAANPVKRFGSSRALAGLDLIAPWGPFYGLFGPEGTGLDNEITRPV
jgi:hypothetical protein